MWGSDYPHSESTFPQSRKILAEILGCVLDQVEGRFPIGQHPAKFAIQVGIPRPQASDGVGDGGVLLGPVVTSPRNDFHSACVESSAHAISIELDLV